MTAIHDFAVVSTRRYLQSVVFVDDEIYVDLPGKVAPVLDIPTEMSVFRKPAPKVAESLEAQPSNDQNEIAERPHYHPKQLVESFASNRMVCALYEPAEGFATDADSEIFRLCERADVVILDWDLYGEDGRNILPLLVTLVSQSQSTVPHHVRLCAIYTTKPDLIKVTSQILEHLEAGGLKVQALSETKLNAGSSRIVVLGKPTVGRSADQIEKAEVAETDLAPRIIEEFASMHEGILPAMALHGMAAVRTSAKKILDKFGANLDGAFLVHRGLLLPGDDAYEQIPELLAEEALAVMEDHPVPSEISDLMSREAIDARGIQLDWAAKEGRPAAGLGQIAIGLLKGGRESVKEDFRAEKQKNWLSALHTAMGSDENSGSLRLAALYNTRTRYSDRKDLTFGTIVRRTVSGEHEYSVCLMPICDSVRLNQGVDLTYEFPFWKFVLSNGGAQARGVVAEVAENEFVELFACGKPRDRLWMEKFPAGARGTVEAQQQNGADLFMGVGGTLEWIGQLKPSHAQRIAQDVGTSFSRVGLVEAEWLRIKSEKR